MLIMLAAGGAPRGRAPMAGPGRRVRRGRVLHRRSAAAWRSSSARCSARRPALPALPGRGRCSSSSSRWPSPAAPAAPSALWCGALIGTVGVPAEWGWSHVWMPLPWPAELLPEAAILGSGPAHGRRRSAPGSAAARPRTRCRGDPRRCARPGRSAPPRSRWIVAVGAGRARARTASAPTVALRRPAAGDARTVERHRDASRRATPPRTPNWFTDIAWQGGGLDRRRAPARGRPGRLPHDRADARPRRVEVVIRLHNGDALIAVPVYLPEDPAIPAAGVAAARALRPALHRRPHILQREQTDDVPAWLPPRPTAAVIAIASCLLALLGVGAAPTRRPAPRRGDASGPDRGPTPTPADALASGRRPARRHGRLTRSPP